jgi:predicted transposase/invertase (TIGR01784 family)
VYYESIAEGEDYKELPNVIAINIVDFDFPKEGNVPEGNLDPPRRQVHTRFNLREAANPSLILTDALEIHFINMVKWRKQNDKDIANNSLHRWLTWFDERSPPELVEEVVSMDNAIKAANERQTYITQDEEARRTYWSRRMAEHDRVSGLDFARCEGQQQGLEIAARNALAKGLPIEVIRDITGLDLETIKQLAEDSGNEE